MASPVKAKIDDQFSKASIAKRRDEALKRALNMPPNPHEKSKAKVAPPRSKAQQSKESR